MTSRTPNLSDPSGIQHQLPAYPAEPSLILLYPLNKARHNIAPKVSIIANTIEPPAIAKSGIITSGSIDLNASIVFSYDLVNLATRQGFEPRLNGLESLVLPLTLPSLNLEHGVGFEPTAFTLCRRMLWTT